MRGYPGRDYNACKIRYEIRFNFAYKNLVRKGISQSLMHNSLIDKCISLIFTESNSDISNLIAGI